MTEDSKPVARFATSTPRDLRIELDWPVEYDGRVYSAIMIKRLTVVEVKAFVEKLDGGKFRFPMFFDEDGVAIPEAVMDALDDDDGMKLDEAAIGFLPRRFRDRTEAKTNDSAPSHGEATGLSSNG